MTLRDELGLIQDYFELVQRGETDVLTCPRDDAAMLHYVDHDMDRVYLQCTVCSHRVYPGAGWWRQIKDIIDGRNHLG